MPRCNNHGATWRTSAAPGLGWMHRRSKEIKANDIAESSRDIVAVIQAVMGFTVGLKIKPEVEE